MSLATAAKAASAAFCCVFLEKLKFSTQYHLRKTRSKGANRGSAAALSSDSLIVFLLSLLLTNMVNASRVEEPTQFLADPWIFCSWFFLDPPTPHKLARNLKLLVQCPLKLRYIFKKIQNFFRLAIGKFRK